jgi:hypothetical protein
MRREYRGLWGVLDPNRNPASIIQDLVIDVREVHALVDGEREVGLLGADDLV